MKRQDLRIAIEEELEVFKDPFGDKPIAIQEIVKLAEKYAKEKYTITLDINMIPERVNVEDFISKIKLIEKE